MYVLVYTVRIPYCAANVGSCRRRPPVDFQRLCRETCWKGQRGREGGSKLHVCFFFATQTCYFDIRGCSKGIGLHGVLYHFEWCRVHISNRAIFRPSFFPPLVLYLIMALFVLRWLYLVVLLYVFRFVGSQRRSSTLILVDTPRRHLHHTQSCPGDYLRSGSIWIISWQFMAMDREQSRYTGGTGRPSVRVSAAETNRKKVRLGYFRIPSLALLWTCGEFQP